MKSARLTVIVEPDSIVSHVHLGFQALGVWDLLSQINSSS